MEKFVQSSSIDRNFVFVRFIEEMRKRILAQKRTFCVSNWLKLRINFLFTSKISIRMFNFLVLIMKSDLNESNIWLSNSKKGV